MKKTLILALCFLFMIAAGCKNSVITENNTTKVQGSNVKSSDNQTDVYTSHNPETIYSTTEKQEGIFASATQTEPVERYDDAPAADTLQFDIKTLKALKKAAETMTDAEFENYLEENRFELAWFELVDTVEDFNALLDDIEDIYVAVLDSNSYDNISLTYYATENRIFQTVSFSETRRFAFDFYVSVEPIHYFENIEGMEYIKTVEINSVKADVFKSENRKGFCADAVFDGQKFDIRVSEAQTTEEFEADLARISFVKIGDLLAE